MSTTSLQVVPLLAVSSTPFPETHHRNNTLTITDPVSFGTSSDQDLARFTSVCVLITTAASSDTLKAFSTIKLARIASMERLTFILRFGIPGYEETRRGWTCIMGVLSGLEGFSAKAPITVFVENAVPLTILRASFSLYAEELNELRRLLLGADKKLVTLIDHHTLSSVSFTLPPPSARYTLEEDEVRLKSLFPALRDFGMLLSP